MRRVEGSARPVYFCHLEVPQSLYKKNTQRKIIHFGVPIWVRGCVMRVCVNYIDRSRDGRRQCATATALHRENTLKRDIFYTHTPTDQMGGHGWYGNSATTIGSRQSVVGTVATVWYIPWY